MRTVRHYVWMYQDSGIVAEADVVTVLCDILDDLTHSPPGAILAVELVCIVQDHYRTILVHEWVKDIARLVYHPAGDNLVGPDIAGPGVLYHADVDLIESVLARSPYGCFECCHIRL